MKFCCCAGPAPGVIVPVPVVSKTVVAADTEIVVKPPSMPSMATKFGFMAAVPHDPTRSPVNGTIRALLTVVGSTIGTPSIRRIRRQRHPVGRFGDIPDLKPRSGTPIFLLIYHYTVFTTLSLNVVPDADWQFIVRIKQQHMSAVLRSSFDRLPFHLKSSASLPSMALCRTIPRSKTSYAS